MTKMLVEQGEPRRVKKTLKRLYPVLFEFVAAIEAVDLVDDDEFGEIEIQKEEEIPSH